MAASRSWTTRGTEHSRYAPAMVKRQVLFIQGGGHGTHDEWDSKLVDSLRRALGPDSDVIYPRMPQEDDPSYRRWKPVLERELGELRDGAVLVGHSVGGTLLIKLLSEQPPVCALGAIVLLAAPFVGEGGWSSEELQLPSDLEARLPEGVPIHVYHGLADEVAPPAHLDLYARAVPRARVHRLPGRDHQLNADLREVAAVIASLDAR